MAQRIHTPVLVVGSGIAGCTAALTLADKGYQVSLVNSGPDLGGGNSFLAQGGIVYKAQEGDDTHALERDILVAGHRYNSLSAVRYLCRKAPDIVKEVLIDRVQVPFDREGDHYQLTREGGHSAPRILHCADYTGRAIMEKLTRVVAQSPNIQVLPHRSAVDLLTSHHQTRLAECRYQLRNQCLGAYVLNEQSGEVETILADWTVLATGGIGQIYLHSTNSLSAVGSGISMAHRAGVRLQNLEFMQFHPTAFFHRSQRRFLITEAMRGEGALLVDGYGDTFMERYDPRKELAPRDIVSQAIVNELLRTGEPCVFLDATRIKHDLKERFPTIFAHCAEMGIDIRQDPIPVVPVAHYFCGGILADTYGRTTLERLYSVGECCCNGIHGANRLASVSLLEALVWGHNAGIDIAKRSPGARRIAKRLTSAIPDWEHLGDDHNDDPVLIAQDWSSIRHTMWNYVGINRSEPRLKRAFEDLRELSRRIHDFYKNTHLSKPLLDLFHGSHAAYVVTQAALRNKESLGCHHRVD